MAVMLALTLQGAASAGIKIIPVTAANFTPGSNMTAVDDANHLQFVIDAATPTDDRPRVIVTSDGEIDDECSMMRFMLYANQWDIEGIVTSSSQYHWQGHKWAGDDWIEPYQLITKALLDDSDDRPIWLQAWGGMNTISRALKTIEDEHPEKMAEVARKLRFFFIWEQDATYQEYIRPHWGKYNIPTIVSDQYLVFLFR